MTFILLVAVAVSGCNSMGTQPLLKNNHFTAHEMSSIVVPLKNKNFNLSHNDDGTVQVIPWTIHIQEMSHVLREDAFADKTALVMKTIKRDDDDDVYDQISTDLTLPAQWQEGRTSFSVSAWVWSNKPLSSFLQVISSQGKLAVSDYHSGKSTWEFLTVVYPYFEPSTSFKVTLANKEGIAKFNDVKPLMIFDDRFENIPNACRPFREKVSYLKGKRVRIVVIGNSTINGIHASRNATFSYVLQSKLESLYPNTFEVINFGLCAWNLASQIVTINSNFHFSLACAGGKADWCKGEYIDHNNVFQQVADATFTNIDELVTLKSLKPDIILLGSMWNDIWRVLKAREYGLSSPLPDEGTVIDSVPFSTLYLQSIYNYAQDPNYENYLIADSLYKFTVRNVERLPSTYDEYVQSQYFKKLSSIAEKKYTYLMRTFISKSIGWTRLWNLSLPSKFGTAYEKHLNYLVAANIVEKDEYDNTKINAFVDSETEQIQNRVIGAVSKENGIPFINLSSVYHQQYDKVPAGALLKLDYFINDNVHFAYRGNEFLADRLFMQMQDEFSELAEEFRHREFSHD